MPKDVAQDERIKVTCTNPRQPQRHLPNPLADCQSFLVVDLLRSRKAVRKLAVPADGKQLAPGHLARDRRVAKTVLLGAPQGVWHLFRSGTVSLLDQVVQAARLADRPGPEHHVRRAP